jgi:GMP synthase-like glutamine amidotransferase
MKLLATGNPCLNQIVKIGSWAYGIQCHFELTSAMMERWINEDPDLQLADRDELHNDFSVLKEQYQQTGHTLFRNFLGLAGFCV